MIPAEVVRGKIYLIRGQKVLMDADLAEMYGVETSNLNKAVKRNLDRFPDDFMFQSRPPRPSIFEIPIWNLKDPPFPYVFTEQGVAMLSSVLKSERAVQVNIAIMRAFVQMRELAFSNRDLARKLVELEQKVTKHDSAIVGLFEAIRQIGFRVEGGEAGNSSFCSQI